MHPGLVSVVVVQAVLNAIGWCLAKVYDVVPNYGITIILFTIGIRIVLLPLGIKQIQSMRAMQAIQPEMKRIQQKYKGDRTRLSEEQMKLYKEHGVNPLGGCVPLLAQFPVLIALYAVLRLPGGLTHIPDDSTLHHAIVHQEAGVYFLGANLLCSAREAGHTVIVPKSPNQEISKLYCGGGSGGRRVTFYVLIFLMIGTTFFQQRQMQRASPGPVNQQQQMLTYLMPAIFGYFGFTFPAGLVLYWCTTNTIQIGQQYFMLYRKGTEPPKQEPDGGKKQPPVKPKPEPPKNDGARRSVRRLEGRPASPGRGTGGSSNQRGQGNTKRTGDAGSRKKRPNR
jgi:YidC/Oxa1 family membrane protein insertase